VKFESILKFFLVFFWFPFFDKANQTNRKLDDIPKDIVEMQKRDTPLENRVGTVEEVAKIVGWLAGGESSWVTGQVISASGGWAMY